MCGIFGFSRLTNTTRAMAPFLAYSMVDRGDDSWGGTDGTNIIKHVCPIVENFYIPEDWTRGIFHTRAASVGEVNEPNAHPFRFDDSDPDNTGPVVGIHNGHINNYTQLNQTYNRDFKVDSMHIFAHIAENKDLEDLSGWGAVAYYRDTLLHLSRFNMDDLHVVKLETGELVFCSTQTPLLKATAMARGKITGTYKLKDNTKYVIEEDDDGTDRIMSYGTMQFGMRNWSKLDMRRSRGRYDFGATSQSESALINAVLATRVASPRDISQLGGVARSEGLCFHCQQVQIDRRRWLLCGDCYDQMLTYSDPNIVGLYPVGEEGDTAASVALAYEQTS
jgi:predicted glutamine amidotransferase